MKLFLRLCLVWAAMTTIASAQTANASPVTAYPYTAKYGKYASDGWQGKSSNNNQWKVYLDYSSSQPVRIELNSGRTARCRLVSPALTMKADHRYTFTFSASAINPNAAMDVTPYLVSTPFTTTIAASTDKIAFTGEGISSTGTSVKTGSFTYDATEGGELYFMLDITTDNSTAHTMVFKSFTVEEVELVKKPMAVENLEVKSIDNATRDITLGWTNPTNYLTGEELAIAGIKVTRNDLPLTTLTDPSLLGAGTIVAWTDTPTESGTYEYALSVIDSEGKESDKCVVKTPFVGKPDAIYPPMLLIFQTISPTGSGRWRQPTAPTAGNSRKTAV